MFGSRSGRGPHAPARNHTVSVHVTSSVSERTFHRTSSWWVVRVLIGVAVGLVLLMAVGVFGLFAWIGSAGRMGRLQAENDSLRVQFQRLGELEANLARMSELNEQMQQMLGVGSSATGGGVDSSGGSGGVFGGGGGMGLPGTGAVPGPGGLVQPARIGAGPSRR